MINALIINPNTAGRSIIVSMRYENPDLSVQTSHGNPTPTQHHGTTAEFNFLTIHAQLLITHRSTTSWPGDL